MKIGFDAKRAFHNQTGLGNYSRSIIESIAKIRTNDKLYLMTPTLNTMNFNTDYKNINVIQPPFFSNKSYWRFKGVNKAIKKLSIDVYHGLSNEIPHAIQTKNVVTIHDLIFLKYPKFYSYFDRNIYHMKSKMACRNADKIIATSMQTKEDIINFFNIPEDRIHVIYQTCQSEFINGPSKQKINNKIIDGIKEPFILYVGGVEKRKNLLFLLQALVKCKKEIKLICVGKNYKYHKKTQEFIIKNKLLNRVNFLEIDNTDTLAMLYRKSRALIYPSIDEGFGIPIIEAMYSKIPVVTSNKAIFKEIGGKHSCYFMEGKVDSLVDKVEKIWTDSKERDNMIYMNLNYVQRFNANDQATKIINIYQKLVNHE